MLFTEYCLLILISPEQLLGPFVCCAIVNLSALGLTLLDSLCKLLFRFDIVLDLIAANSSMVGEWCQGGKRPFLQIREPLAVSRNLLSDYGLRTSAYDSND